MNPQEAIRVRASAQHGKAVDEVAEWYFTLLRTMEISEGRRLPGFTISAPSFSDSRLDVQGHHHKMAAFYRHAWKDGRLVGRIEFCPVSKGGELGESILEFTVTDCGVSFDENTFFEHHLVDQPDYDQIRLATAYRIMWAIQRNMHKFESEGLGV